MTTKKLKDSKTKVAKYDADDIAWNIGLEGPRADPSMYLGSAGADAILQMAKEIAGNSIDELNAIGGGKLHITIDKDNNVTVTDNGRGVPIDPHKRDKKRSTAEIVFSELHAGGKGKGSGDAYQDSIGTHGVGSAVTNACSEIFVPTIKRGGKVYKLAWAKGKLKHGLKVIGKCPKAETGTSVKFRHDPTVLSGTPKWDKLVEWLETLSYFTPTITYYLTINHASTGKAEFKKTIHRKNGLADWLHDHRPADDDIETITKPIVLQTAGMDLALQWFGTTDDGLKSYVSAIETKEGGTHHKAVEKAISVVLEKYTSQRGALKKNYKPEDLRAGLVGAINLRMKSPKFSSQTKERLSSPEGETIVFKDAVKQLSEYFDKHKSVAKAIIERANRLRGMENSFKLSKAAEAKMKPKRGQHSLPTKLAVSTTKDRNRVELYIVEGDGAGGSAKQARDKVYQEVLPMKGKPPNLYKGNTGKHLENDEIVNMVRSIGYDPTNKDNPLAKMRVGKIILLADSDPDGQHITNLFLSVLWMLMPQLFAQHRVFIVSDALFMAKSATRTMFGKTAAEAIKLLGAPHKSVSRIKGWGEMSPPDLKPFVFDPEHRQHILVTPEGAEKLASVMGEDVKIRKKLLNV